MIGAYLHIPFCSHICYYCDFNKVFIEGQPVDEYLHYLRQEMQQRLQADPVDHLDTLYIGGGTPTALSTAQLDTLLQSVRDTLPFDQGEFTVEANPNDFLTMDKLQVLKNYGVNRLSIGVQSFDDEILKKIGRTHTRADVHQALANVAQAGFDNVSIDLIFRLPGQDLANFKRSLDEALALELPHYATYSLILEKKTIFYNQMRQGRLFLPSQDVEADMYDLAIDRLQQAGRQQYEISNFAKPGFQSQHNLLYWRNEHYYGFGAGAHGYLGRQRYQNNGPIQQYLAPLRAGRLPVFQRRVLSLSEQIEEELFLGLRKREGISPAHFHQKFHVHLTDVYGQTIPELIQAGLMEQVGERLTLTKKGLFLGNDVFEAFLIDEDL